jgi:hypothetical protein
MQRTQVNVTRGLALPTVCNDDIAHPEASAVANQGRQTRLVEIVGDQCASVLHHVRNIRRFAAWRRAHIEDALACFNEKCIRESM